MARMYFRHPSASRDFVLGQQKLSLLLKLVGKSYTAIFTADPDPEQKDESWKATIKYVTVGGAFDDYDVTFQHTKGEDIEFLLNEVEIQVHVKKIVVVLHSSYGYSELVFKGGIR